MPSLREIIARRRAHLFLTARRRLKVLKPARPLPPIAIERSYQRRLSAVASSAMAAVRLEVLPKLAKLINQAGYAKVDDWTGEYNEMIRLVKSTWAGPSQAEYEALASSTGMEINVYSRRELTRILARALGVDVFSGEGFVKGTLAGFVAENVTRIKSIPEKLFGDVETTILRGIRSGMRVETLADLIEERYQVASSRAELIARDQVLKFNGELSKLRQQDLKIEEYIWRTAGDEAVRKTHAELDGETFRWDDPPVTNISGDRNAPGGDYQCRCAAEPVLPVA